MNQQMFYDLHLCAADLNVESTKFSRAISIEGLVATLGYYFEKKTRCFFSYTDNALEMWCILFCS